MTAPKQKSREGKARVKKRASAASVPERAGKHGGKLLTGNPGNKGGGRTPDEFKQKMAELVSSDQVFAYMQRCLSGIEGPKAFASAVAFCAERGYGRVPQPVEVGNTDDKPLTIRVVRE